MLALRTLSLLGGFWPFVAPPSHHGGRAREDAPEILLLAILVVIAALAGVSLAMKAIANLKRARLRNAMSALPQRPTDSERCIVAATVTSGDVKNDPWWDRPAVWSRLSMMVREMPPGETYPPGVTLVHGARVTLSAGDATIDLDGRNLEAFELHDSVARHAYSDQLPEHLRATLTGQGTALRWSDGSPILWLLSAQAIRVGDPLTIVGTARATAHAGTEVEAIAAASGESGYREGPTQRTFWKFSSGPGRGGAPMVSSLAPDAIPTALAELLLNLGDTGWFDR